MKVRIINEEVSFASVEDVVIHKIFAGRPRDIEDVRAILLKNRDVDVEYIRRWLKDFDSLPEGEGVLATFEAILKDL